MSRRYTRTLHSWPVKTVDGSAAAGALYRRQRVIKVWSTMAGLVVDKLPVSARPTAGSLSVIDLTTGSYIVQRRPP